MYTYKNLNVAGLEPAPPGDRPGVNVWLSGQSSVVQIFIRFLNKYFSFLSVG